MTPFTVSGFKVNGVDLGTSEAEWETCRHLRAVPSMTGSGAWSGAEHVVVVAPHPDDEVLAVGGTLCRLARAGATVSVVAVTDGEASHPGSPVDPLDLAARRRKETGVALDRLGLGGIAITRLGLPDGGLADCEDELTAVLVPLLVGAARCLTTWRGDGHPDHEAVGRAAAAACTSAGTVLAEYPVWAWHWARPGAGDLPWARARRVALDGDELAVKREAIAAYRSQVQAIGPTPEEAAVLPPAVLERFTRPYEIVFV